MTRPPVQLSLEARRTLLALDDGRVVALPVGAHGLVESALRHDPPTPAELERAIDLVEDALTGWSTQRADDGRLVTGDPLLQALPGLDAPGAGLGRDAVEALFQRLASRALGSPVAAAELPHGRHVAAALLILRECMHHLDFRRVEAART